MWVLNSDRDILINLETGLRIAIMPTKKDGEAQLYGVVVQAPAEATLPVGRPLPTGFSNTILLSGAPLDDCRNLLEIFRRGLLAYEVTDCPILPPDEEEDVCYVLRIKGQASPCYVGDGDIPADRTEAIDRYFDEGAKEESYEIIVAPFIRRKDLKRGK